MRLFVRKTKLIGVLSKFVNEFPEGTILFGDGDFIIIYHPTSIDILERVLRKHGLLTK